MASAVLVSLRRASGLPATLIVLPGSLAATGPPPGVRLAGPVLAGPVLAGPVLAGPVLVGGLALTLPPAPFGGRPVFDPLRYGLTVSIADTITASSATIRLPASSGMATPVRRNGARQRRLRCCRRIARSSR